MTGISGLLLTGGSSRRLGVDKATLILEGETLAARAARLLTDRCSEVVEVGPGVTSLRAVRETPAGAGPLAALVAGASGFRDSETDSSGALILLACDLPWVAPVLDALVAAPAQVEIVVPVDEDGRRQYVCTRYGPRAVAAASVLLEGGERSLHALVASIVDVLEVGGFASGTFADIDVPDDARRAGIELTMPARAAAPDRAANR